MRDDHPGVDGPAAFALRRETPPVDLAAFPAALMAVLLAVTLALGA